MDCPQVKELLSAYYDQELSSEVQTAVAQHLADCENCAAELVGFGELSAAARTLSHPVPPAQIWKSLETQLYARPNDDATTQSRGWMTWMSQRAAVSLLVTSALLLLAIAWFSYALSSRHDEHQMTAVFGQYLDQFQSDPHAAQDVLLTNYDNHAVSPDQATNSVGYRPLVADGLPLGYAVVSTHVMKMPCCTCVQSLCRRDDGTMIAIFEHDDEEPDWFGDRASRDEVCNGTRCHLVLLDDRLAAIWRRGERHITVIGARNTREISLLVAWFDERRKHHLN